MKRLLGLAALILTLGCGGGLGEPNFPSRPTGPTPPISRDASNNYRDNNGQTEVLVIFLNISYLLISNAKTELQDFFYSGCFYSN